MIIKMTLFLCLGWCYGQECIDNFEKLEKAICGSTNQYQIAKAYFPAKREISPVCVTSYYYIGVNRSDAVAKDCPVNMLPKEDQDDGFVGCMKWKWCINSFYVNLNLAQLEDYSFHILLDGTSEVSIELPPLCNITKTVRYEYFLRITLLVSS